MLNQRVYQVASGWENGNDGNTLREDPEFKTAAKRLPLSGNALASQPTISRFENSVSTRELYCIAESFVRGQLPQIAKGLY